MLSRRAALSGLFALAAPAIIRTPRLLMRVKAPPVVVSPIDLDFGTNNLLITGFDAYGRRVTETVSVRPGELAVVTQQSFATAEVKVTRTLATARELGGGKFVFTYVGPGMPHKVGEVFWPIEARPGAIV